MLAQDLLTAMTLHWRRTEILDELDGANLGKTAFLGVGYTSVVPPVGGYTQMTRLGFDNAMLKGVANAGMLPPGQTGRFPLLTATAKPFKKRVTEGEVATSLETKAVAAAGIGRFSHQGRSILSLDLDACPCLSRP